MSVKRPPGPKGKFLVGSALELIKDPTGFLGKNLKEYGDLVYFKLGPKNTYQINKPEYIKHILQDNNKNYTKSVEYDHLKLMLGQGLVTSEGEFWRRQRRIAQPAFHKKEISTLAETMTVTTAKMIDNWTHISRNGESIDVANEMMMLTLEIVGKTLLSKDVSHDAGRLGPAISYVIEWANNRIMNPFNWPPKFPIPKNNKFWKSKELLDDVIYGIIEERRESSGDYHDLLQMLMDARDEETGEGMTNEQLRDEAMTIFLAGHETTANALAWLCYLLAENPDETEKIANEIKEVLGERTPTAGDVRNLKYTSQAIEEGMRLYPPAWIFGRKSKEADKLGEYEIPGGSDIMICSYILQRSPEFWEDPEKFDPERFSEENSKARPRYHYFPFGGGQRFCIGNNFAMMEMILIVVMVIQKFRLKLVPGHIVERNHLVTLRPKYGIKMTVHGA